VLNPGTHRVAQPIEIGPPRDHDEGMVPTDPDLPGSSGPASLAISGIARPACVLAPASNWGPWGESVPPGEHAPGNFLMTYRGGDRTTPTHLTIDLSDFKSGQGVFGGLLWTQLAGTDFIEDHPPERFSKEEVASDLEIWGPGPEAAPSAAEPLYYVQETATAPLLKYSHVRLPCPSQPFLVQRPRSYPNLISDLIDCGDAFSKTGTFGSGTYSAAAVSVGGGWYDDPESGPTLAAAPLFMLDCLLVSAGGGTGVECTSGGTESAVRSTASHLFHSCIAGFETDLKMDTSGAWEAQTISEVFYYQDPTNPSFELHGFGQISPHSYLDVGAEGKISLYGYNSWAERAELYYINQYEEPKRGQTGTGPYTYIMVVLDGPVSHTYTEAYSSAPPVAHLYLRFKPSSSETYRDLHISVPPIGSIADSEPTIAYLVGSHGETFLMPEWGSGIDSVLPIGSKLDSLANLLASEWAEMRLHGTAHRTSVGNVSLDPSYERN